MTAHTHPPANPLRFSLTTPAHFPPGVEPRRLAARRPPETSRPSVASDKGGEPEIEIGDLKESAYLLGPKCRRFKHQLPPFPPMQTREFRSLFLLSLLLITVATTAEPIVLRLFLRTQSILHN